MAISFITPTKEVKKISDFRSKIIIKPLMKGFGVTLGNALRRVLLSSIPGCSMFGIRVNNSNTIEFRAIPGLIEDCTQLILNLKKLVITSNLDDSEFENFKLENWPTLKINFSGKGVITGKDIECPSFFNVVNKDLIIANSENDYTKFVLEIFCTKGIGFRDFRKNIDIIGKTNTIVATDSDFSPVINVGYVVEEVKVSNIISTEQLILDVSTNGSITPEESINMACDILDKHLSILSENDNLVQNFNFTNKTNGNKKVAFTTIDDLELSANASKKIKDSAIHTIDQLINLSIEEINEI
jgi:DNA-directed RNA polymerase subunit alpha